MLNFKRFFSHQVLYLYHRLRPLTSLEKYTLRHFYGNGRAFYAAALADASARKRQG